jgi:autotransporter-associated beta strand protein
MKLRLPCVTPATRKSSRSKSYFAAAPLLVVALIFSSAGFAFAQTVEFGGGGNADGVRYQTDQSGNKKHTPKPRSTPGVKGDPFWDPTSGGPSGTWDTSLLNWSPTVGGGSQAAWVNGSDAVFSATGIGTTAFTVTIKKSTSISAGSITVNNSGALTITGDSTGSGSNLSLGAGGITINSGAGAVTINNTTNNTNSNFTLTAVQTWTNNSSNLFTVSSNVTNGPNLLTIDGTGNTTISGALGSGAGGLTKNGSGTLILSGPNTYTGATTVNNGSLFVNGSTVAASAVTVNNSGTTLGGSGTIGGTVNVASGANLSPGATGVGSTAILHTGALTLASGSFFNVDLNNTTAGTGYDQLISSHILSIAGSTLKVIAANNLAVGNTFFIMEDSSSNAAAYGMFSNGSTVTATNGDTFMINYGVNGDGGTVANDISLTALTVVPEPSPWIGGALALAALLAIQRRHLARLLKLTA